MPGLRELLVKTFNETDDILTKEQQSRNIVNNHICQEVQAAFEQLDDQLLSRMHEQGWKVARKDKRQIQYSYGCVEFERRLYRRGKEWQYPVDQVLGIKPYQRYSLEFMATVAGVGTENTYRKSARAIERLTQNGISNTTVRAIINRLGQKASEFLKYQKQYALPKVGQRQVSALYLEGDAIAIKSQSNTIMYLHRFQVHEGTKRNGKKSICINLKRFSNFSRAEAFKRLLTYLHSTYDLTNTKILSNSDNGSGYEPSVFKELAFGSGQHEHFLDRYHLHKKLKDRMDFCQELLGSMTKAINAWSKDKVTVVIDTMLAIATDNDSKEQVLQTRALKNYLWRNWEWIKPFRLRELDDLKQKGLGVCESNHRPYTYRMKRQGRSWSRRGAANITQLIDAISNGEFSKIVNFTSAQITEQYQDEISTESYLADYFEPHVGVRHGSINSSAPEKGAVGHIRNTFD